MPRLKAGVQRPERDPYGYIDEALAELKQRSGSKYLRPPKKNDLYITRTCVWFDGKVRRDKLAEYFNVWSGYVVNETVVRLPLLVMSLNVLRSANQNSGMSPKRFKRVFGFEGMRQEYCIQVRSMAASAFTAEAENVRFNGYLRKWRRKVLRPITRQCIPITEFGCTVEGVDGLSDVTVTPHYVAVPLAPVEAASRRDLVCDEWGLFHDRIEVQANGHGDPS